VNHPDNQIPLCGRCHPRFDKPRTLKEYEELASIKQKLIDRAAQRALTASILLKLTSIES